MRCGARRRSRARTAVFVFLAGGCGRMAGNGRGMKNSGQDPEEEQQQLDSAEGAGSKTPEIIDSVAWLCDLADKELGKNGRTIIGGLVEKAKKGDVSSIKELQRLAKGKTLKDACLAQGGKTLAQMLAEEPEWPGPSEGAETGKNDGEPDA